MRIKKIHAKTFGQALTLVKKELGADAVILSSEDKKGSRPYVEVTAAIDYDMEKVSNDHYVRECSHEGSDNFMTLQNEIKDLRNYIESMKNSGYELSLRSEKRDMFCFLKDRAIKDEFALRLIERANAIEDIESVMCNDLDIPNKLNDPFLNMKSGHVQRERKIIMLIGPTGVGKTTTIAKLASMAIRKRKKVALMSFDTFKIGAAEQIRIYSRMIGIPLDIVSNKDNFIRSTNRFSDRDVILVDTTGQNPRDDAYLNGLRSIYETGMQIETQLLLSTSSDCNFLVEAHKYYDPLPLDYMAFTKTDEAVSLGSIYNLCRLYKRPVAYITTGQRVPGNIEFVDSKKLTNLILRTGSA